MILCSCTCNKFMYLTFVLLDVMNYEIKKFIEIVTVCLKNILKRGKFIVY